MPAIKPLTESQKLKQRLLENIRLCQGGRSDAQMGKLLGISSATYYRRRTNPQNLTVGEVALLCQSCKVPVDEFLTKNLKIGG